MFANRVPVTLLTGFLGSGKTTLLSRLLADPRMQRTAVVINEIGEIGLDHLLVGRPDDDTYLLKSGCVCCNMKSDLSETLKSLRRRAASGELPAFDRIVVETTGLADPVPMLRHLLADETLNAAFRLQTVLATVDSVLPLDASRDRPERHRQIGVADKLIVTKTDLSGRFEVMRAALEALNPGAQILDSQNLDAVMQAIFDHERYAVVRHLPDVCWEKPTKGFGREGQAPHDSVSTLALRVDEPLSWPDVAAFLQQLARRHGEKLLRTKGILNVKESSKPIIIHGVQQYLYPETYLDAHEAGDTTSRIVFIFEGSIEAEIRELFARCVSRSAEIMPA
ncbi:MULTISPECIES: GTP-binding protein [unclassified Paraburkholderia]|uniref:CobW family GTP-binding protein n=1 Tax=unclassified Paraburkholderia TaxID=2615204 RepID=UPI002AAF42D0|nr:MULTISPECIES: GTP-binding protein [unclassified Paraburkholderia]